MTTTARDERRQAFAAMLQAFMRDTGMKQAQLAYELGSTQANVSNWLSGRFMPANAGQVERRIQELRASLPEIEPDLRGALPKKPPEPLRADGTRRPHRRVPRVEEGGVLTEEEVQARKFQFRRMKEVDFQTASEEDVMKYLDLICNTRGYDAMLVEARKIGILLEDDNGRILNERRIRYSVSPSSSSGSGPGPSIA